MRHTFFVPARNSRHRVAALALYRALFRSARQIGLPEDVSSKGPRHPVAHLVKKRFQSNKNYTSLRLVYSSMSAGYKFLAMLTRARDPTTPEHDQVVDLLRKRNIQAAVTRNALPPRKPSRPRREKPEDHVPVLTNVAGPGEAPKYVGRVRPADTLSKPRRPPTLAAESLGYPFLRYSKPQPKILGNMIGRGHMLWESRVTKTMATEQKMIPAAVLEDCWDDLMHGEMIRAGIASPDSGLRQISESFLWSAVLSKLWYELRLERMWQHWSARGTAMQRLIKEETALAEKERREREGLSATSHSESQDAELPQRSEHQPIHPPSSPQRSSLSASVPRMEPMPALRAQMTVLREEYLKKGVPVPEDGPDPFLNPVWAAVVERSDDRLWQWVEGAAPKNSNLRIYPSRNDTSGNTSRSNKPRSDTPGGKRSEKTQKSRNPSPRGKSQANDADDEFTNIFTTQRRDST